MRQRIRQFWQAGVAPSGADFELAERLLSPALLEVFRAQHPRDIVHSVATARWLLVNGETSSDLLVAALIHDIGKGDQRRADRAVSVVAEATRTRGLVASASSRFELRRAVSRTAEHSELGARLAAEAGAAAAVVDLIRRHHMPPAEDGVLALLQRADAVS